ncbi:MAG: hypothetical protein JWN00_314 [Actinomycetia bacterium]|jgi:hypothetical protein|nr:hypothetical protein [Actinomycetes bacterium]
MTTQSPTHLPARLSGSRRSDLTDHETGHAQRLACG